MEPNVSIETPPRRPVWPTLVAVVGLLAVVLWLIFRPGAVRVDNPDFHAGEVVFNHVPGVVDHVFVLTNTSSEPVRIEAANATCGCTEVVPPLAQIEPGEAMDLPVTLRLDHSGEKTGGVVLILDNGERVNLTMTALGKLTHPIILKPRNLVLKGRSVRPMLQLEWPSATEQPPQAQLASTGGVSFQTEPWSLQAKPNDKGMPALWRARLVVMDRPDEAGEGELTVTVGDLPPSVMQVSWTARAPRTLPQAPSPAGPAASP